VRPGDAPEQQTGAFHSALAWLIAVVAAGVALFRRADARSSVAVVLLLVVSAVPIAWHVPPFGPAGLALFVVAVLQVCAPGPRLGRPPRLDSPVSA
jgi:hypothetical protein